MSWVQHQLMPIEGPSMTSDFGGAVQNPHQRVGRHQRQLATYGFWRDRVIVAIETDIDGFRCPHGYDQVGAEGMQRVWQQAWALFGESLFHRAAVISRPRPLMRDLVTPSQRLPVALGQRSEAPARPKRIPNIANRSFHPALLIRGTDLAGTCDKVIMRAQFQQTGMKVDLIAAALQHGAAEIVIEDDAGLPTPVLKRVHMAAQKVLHGLIEEELQIQHSRVRQCDDEAGQSAARAPHGDLPEVGPIDLGLLSRKSLQVQESFARRRTQSGHAAPELDDAAAIPAFPDHLVNAGGAQPGMLI